MYKRHFSSWIFNTLSLMRLDGESMKYFLLFNSFAVYTLRISSTNHYIFRMYHLGIVVFKYFYFKIFTDSNHRKFNQIKDSFLLCIMQFGRKQSRSEVEIPTKVLGLPRWLSGKESAWNAGTAEAWFGFLSSEGPLEEGIEPTPLFLPGASHEQRSLVGYRLWSRRVRYNWSNLTCTHQDVKLVLSFCSIICLELKVVVWPDVVLTLGRKKDEEDSYLFSQAFLDNSPTQSNFLFHLVICTDLLGKLGNVCSCLQK